MRLDVKSGIQVVGTLTKDPILRQVGNSCVLKMNVRYTLPPNPETGKRPSDYLNVDVWDGAEDLDGMFQKGDVVIIVGDEITSREFNGKTYQDMRGNAVIPTAQVVFRWLQTVVNMIPMPGACSAPVVETPPQAAPTQPERYEPQPLYEGEQLSDYSPDQSAAPDGSLAADPLGDATIEEDPDDLPF